MPELVDYVDAADRPVRTGPRGGAHAAGLLYRVAATLLTDPRPYPHGRVLVYRRPDESPVLPGHHDVLIGGSVHAGESPAQAAARELAEEFGPHATHATNGARPHAVWRECIAGPAGPCWLTVHHAHVPEEGALRPDPAEIAWHGFLPLDGLLSGAHPRPFNPVGLRALRHLPDVGTPRHLPLTEPPQTPRPDQAGQANAPAPRRVHKRQT